MKVRNMTSNKGNKIANQFIIEDVMNNSSTNLYRITCSKDLTCSSGEVFQSYNSVIAWKHWQLVVLDEKYWNYSKTTSKYRNIFLGETTKETQAKIDSGEYILTNLN